MKNKRLIVLLVLVAVVVGVVLIARPLTLKKPVAKKALPTAKVGKKPVPAPVKRAITKDKGGLIIKIVDSKKKELHLRIRAFKSVDARSSVYIASFVANRLYELSPGSYDVEIDTVPQKIYKNVNVAKEKENVVNLGQITGSVNVKALNAQKNVANYPIRILYSKSADVAMTAATNRPIEILPGVYDLEIGTLPRQIKKDLKVEAGKEAALDLGCITGTLIVKALDENKKEVRYTARITKSENNEVVTSTTTNRPIEILQGTYDIELFSTPRQEKKDLKVKAAEEALVEFLVQTPPLAPTTVPPKKPKT